MTMRAGRELDALIAENVKKDRLIKRGAWKGYWDCGKGRHWAHEDGGPPLYSTDIAAVWLVVENLRGDFELDLSDHILFWTARFTKMGASMHPVIDAPTAPHAICLAALDAIGYKP